jgi:hypothetical protein
MSPAFSLEDLFLGSTLEDFIFSLASFVPLFSHLHIAGKNAEIKTSGEGRGKNNPSLGSVVFGGEDFYLSYFTECCS